MPRKDNRKWPEREVTARRKRVLETVGWVTVDGGPAHFFAGDSVVSACGAASEVDTPRAAAPDPGAIVCRRCRTISTLT